MHVQSVLLQEGDDEFRQGIKTALAVSDVWVLSYTCKSFQSLTDHFFYYLPDVIILNWQYNTTALFDFIKKALVKVPQLKIIVTFDFVQPDFVFQLQQLGVAQCMLKPFLAQDILSRDLKYVINCKFDFHLGRLLNENKNNQRN